MPLVITLPAKELNLLNKRIKGTKAPLTSAQASKMGKAIVKEMKDFIEVGTSPIRNAGRFEGYRGSYKQQIEAANDPKKKKDKKSPIVKFDKKLRPVNLTLSGKFLKNLKSKVVAFKGRFTVEIGYRKPSEAAKEVDHRKGTNNQAERPTIPIDNEQFVESINVEIIKAYNMAIAKIVNKPIK